MAYQLPGGGGGGVAPNLHQLLLPGGGEQAPPAVPEVDRISSLPENLRLRIMGSLPLKTAMKLGMVSRSWSRLVNRPCDSVLPIHVHPATPGPCGCSASHHVRADQIAPLLGNELATRGRGPDHRLQRVFLKVDDAQTRPADFDSLIGYAADCDVDDFLVCSVLEPPPGVSFNFKWAFHRLVRLVLSGIGVTEVHLRRMSQVRSINTLEIISINSSILGNLDLQRVLLLCPRLRSLTLRNCRFLTCVAVTAASEHLVRLTVAKCPHVDEISVSAALSLQTFQYVGDLLRSVALPPTCFRDLRICFTKMTILHRVRIHNWLDALPNLFNLVKLSICSNALEIISRLDDVENFLAQVAGKWSNLQLIELQLVLYRIDTDMLYHVYRFLRICRCSRMRNLFVELPKATTDSLMNAVGGGLAKEPRMDDFESLVKVKITNFKWQFNEIELVHFWFRKARSLQKLILVVPKGTNPQRDQSGNAIFPQLNLLLLENAPANVEVQVLSEFSDSRFVLID